MSEKKMQSDILKHLPKKNKEKKVFIQGHVDHSVYQETSAYMQADGYTWPELLSACLKAYCEQKARAPKKIRGN